MLDFCLDVPTAELADAVEACHLAVVDAECRMLELAAAWADAHPGELVAEVDRPGRETPRQLGGFGTPTVAGFAPAELGALTETTTVAADYLVADALDLRHRLPRLWERVKARTVRAWKARRVARLTRHLTPEAAAYVDAATVDPIGSLPWTRFENLLYAAILTADPEDAARLAERADSERFVRAGRSNRHGLKTLVAQAGAGDVTWFLATVDRIADLLAEDGDLDPIDVRRSKAIGILAQPAEALRLLCRQPTSGDADVEPLHGEPPIDPEACRPKAVVYVHLASEVLATGEGVARVEDYGPILASRLRRLIGEHSQIVLRPVLDLADDHPVDAYEIPDRVREILHLRQPADAFPFGVNTGRRQDVDHVIPYRPLENGGAPGQTSADLLAKMVRLHHRIKTHGRWRLRQPEPLVYVWRTPHGRYLLVNSSGTHPLGSGPFARTIWNTAAPSG